MIPTLQIVISKLLSLLFLIQGKTSVLYNCSSLAIQQSQNYLVWKTHYCYCYLFWRYSAAGQSSFSSESLLFCLLLLSSQAELFPQEESSHIVDTSPDSRPSHPSLSAGSSCRGSGPWSGWNNSSIIWSDLLTCRKISRSTIFVQWPGQEFQNYCLSFIYFKNPEYCFQRSQRSYFVISKLILW